MEFENDVLEVTLIVLWGVLPLLVAIGILAFCVRRLRDLEVVSALTSDYQGSIVARVCQLKDDRDALRGRVAELEVALEKAKEIPY